MGLKIIHTSDWHLGKKLSKVERIEEQKLFLEWLKEIIIKQEVDLLLVSGDIFDSPNPPTFAIKLYFDFLKEINSKTKCKTLIISGNHDSGRFLNAPKSILDDLNVHICGKLIPINHTDFASTHKVTIQNNDHQVNIVLLPYFRSHEIYNLVKADQELSIEEKINHSLNSFFDVLLDEKSSNSFNILMGHHLFEGFELSGSEQVISLSGVESISRDLINTHFDYTALGHIHKTMCLNKTKDNIYYSGAPLNYRFKEKGKKNIIFLELEYINNEFKLNKELIQIPEFRKIIKVKVTKDNYINTLDDLIDSINQGELHPFIEIRLSLESPDHELVSSIKEKISDLDHSYISFYTDFNSQMDANEDKAISNINDYNLIDLFELYYKEKFPDADTVDENILGSFKELIISASHLSSDEEVSS